MVNILAQHGIAQLDTVRSREDLRRRAAAASRAAAQLSDRVLARGRARLLHDALVGAARRQADAGQGAVGARGRVVRRARRELEAFHTAGGLSTMAFRYEGKIPTMEYKTLRYPGHAHIMEAIRELGLLDLTPVEVKGAKVIPRDLFVSARGPPPHEARGARSRGAARDRRGRRRTASRRRSAGSCSTTTTTRTASAR